MIDVLVIGAGVAGLACASLLQQGSMRVTVLDKATEVGGRCATRHIEGQPVDYGVVFLHGSNAEFRTAIEAVEGQLDGWPWRRKGAGAPCQPGAFDPSERRLAYRQGVRAFAEQLAKGLDVQFNRRVSSLQWDSEGVRAVLADGAPVRARHLVLALPLERTVELLEPHLNASHELQAIGRLLRMVASVPCLTVAAGYSSDVGEPDWDIWYPEQSRIVQLIVHDSSKRVKPRQRVLVVQALPRWSREHLATDPQHWGEQLVQEAARLAGPWVARPQWLHTHRWRSARVDRGSELSSPVLVPVAARARLGLAGDIFAPGGGVQAAWLSGRRLAQRLLHEERA